MDSQLQLVPLNIIRSGYYVYDTNDVDYGYGRYWQLESYSIEYVNYLLFFSTYLNPQHYRNKGDGFAIRCLVPLEIRPASQLPTYSGTKSYQNLLVEVYGGQQGSDWPGTQLDTITQNSPIKFIRSGRYYISGDISNRGSNGFYWQSESGSIDNTRAIRFGPAYLHPQNAYSKGLGYSLRCLVR